MTSGAVGPSAETPDLSLGIAVVMIVVVFLTRRLAVVIVGVVMMMVRVIA